jgi:hypothetical protein
MTSEVTVVACSDFHGHLPEIPACDLLLLGGDLVGPEHEADHDDARRWIAGEFADWLAAVPAAEVVGIAGNHDAWAGEVGEGVHRGLLGGRWTYLQDAELRTACGLRVYGSPWLPVSFPSPFEASPEALRAAFARIPTGLDVLLIHLPPDGHGDTLDSGLWLGCKEIVPAIERAQPRVVIFGHCHDGGGYRGRIGASVLANVALADSDNRPVRAPYRFTLRTVGR